MASWWQQVVRGLKQKLRELQEVLDTPIVPERAPVPIPVRPRPRGR